MKVRYSFLRENSPDRVSLPRAADVPILTVFGEKDDLVVAATQRDAVRRMCGAGQRIEYVECAGKGHADSVVAAFPYIHAWTQDRLAGKPLEAAKTCVVGSAVDCTNL